MIKQNATQVMLLAMAGGLALPWAAYGFAERIPLAQRGPTDGVVIAETRMAVGASSGVDALGQPLDCDGPPLKVSVNSVQGVNHALYDAMGEPCAEANLLFDGTSPLGQRAADPAVQIGFLDALGPVAAPTLPALPRIEVSSEFLQQASRGLEAGSGEGLGKPVAPAKPKPADDPLRQTILAWQGGLADVDEAIARKEISGQSEATLAALRNLDRTTGAVAGQRDKVNMLLAALREKERELAEAEARTKASRAATQQQRALAEGTLSQAQQAEQAMRSELQAARERLAALEAQNQQLASTKVKQERMYQERIATLAGDVKAAENRAQASRQVLVAEAAAKIAEAEALANAARLAEADAKAREAARLKQEAETMLTRAMDLANNKAVIMAGMEDISPKAAPMALLEVPVVFHATNQNLPDLLQAIVKQAEPQAGAWRADFQLTSANSYILAEKWSLTAEAPVKALLDNLQQQIKAAHGITLTFTQFPQSRLLVVTD